MSYITRWEQDGVCQVFRGTVTTADREKSYNEVVESPRFDTLKYWIIDTTEIDEYLLTEIDAKNAAALDLGASFTNSRIHQIFVTTNANHLENIRRYKAILKKANSPWKVSVFCNINLARDLVARIRGGIKTKK